MEDIRACLGFFNSLPAEFSSQDRLCVENGTLCVLDWVHHYFGSTGRTIANRVTGGRSRHDVVEVFSNSIENLERVVNRYFVKFKSPYIVKNCLMYGINIDKTSLAEIHSYQELCDGLSKIIRILVCISQSYEDEVYLSCQIDGLRERCTTMLTRISSLENLLGPLCRRSYDEPKLTDQ